MNNENKSIRVTISNRTVVRIIAIIVTAYLSIKLIIKVDHVLELIFVSLFLAVALNPAVSWFARNLKLKSRGAATGIAYLFVVGIIVGFFALVLPPLIKQTEKFITTVPETISTLKDPHSGAGKVIKHYKLNKTVDNISTNISNHTSNIASPVWSTASKIGSIVSSVILVLVLTFMMIVEGPSWIDKYWKLRFKKHDWHLEMTSKMYKIVTGYVNGQLLLALLTGIVTLLSLFIVTRILHVSVNEIALAGIMMILSLIPLFGHIIGTVVVIIACLFVSWPLALIIAIILIVYTQLASVSIQPYIQAKYNDITPMLVLIAALIGINIAGILGAFVAIPIAGCLKIAFKEYLLHRNMLD